MVDFAHLDAFPVVLPSRGKFSSGNVPETVYIKPFSSDDYEKLIAASGPEALDLLLEKSLSGKYDFELDDLYEVDRVELFRQLRIITVGDIIHTSRKCSNPKCEDSASDSDKTIPVTIDLNSVVVNYVDEDAEYPISYTLPGSNKTISFRVLSRKDVKTVDDRLKLKKKAHREFDPDKERARYILATRLVSVDGEPFPNWQAAHDFVKALSVKDYAAFIEYSSMVNEIGPELWFEYECPTCGRKDGFVVYYNSLEFFRSYYGRRPEQGAIKSTRSIAIGNPRAEEASEPA